MNSHEYINELPRKGMQSAPIAVARGELGSLVYDFLRAPPQRASETSVFLSRIDYMHVWPLSHCKSGRRISGPRRFN